MGGAIYPRTYRYGPGWLTFLTAFALALAAGCALLAQNLYAKSPVVAFGFAVLGGLGIPALVVGCVYVRLTLYEDKLDYRGVFGRAVIPRANIEKTSGAQRNWGSASICLHLRGKGARKKISALGKVDDVFWRWFDGIPNEESEAQVKRSEHLLANPAFGGSPTERAYAINRDADWLNRAHWVSIAITFWGLFWPQPYALCLGVLAGFPVLAAMAAILSFGRWTLNDDDGSGRIGIGGMMAVSPACVLALRAFMDDHMVDWILPVLYGGIAGIVLLLVVALTERRLSGRTAVVGVFAYCLYAWGVLLYIDTTFDSGAAKIVAVKVVDVDDGNKTHELTVTPWENRRDNNSVSVGSRFIKTVKPGDTVCVYVYPGLVDLPWYEVGHCPK